MMISIINDHPDFGKGDDLTAAYDFLTDEAVPVSVRSL